jgi:hypothetical protein
MKVLKLKKHKFSKDFIITFIVAFVLFKVFEHYGYENNPIKETMVIQRNAM